MARNIHNERVQLYLADPEYFKKYIRTEKNYWSKTPQRNFEIAITYLENKRSLFEVGRAYHISKERVRQIIAKFLFKVVKLSIKLEKDMKKDPIKLKKRRGYSLFQAEPAKYSALLHEKFLLSEQTDKALLFFETDRDAEQIAEDTKTSRAYIYILINRALDWIEKANPDTALPKDPDEPPLLRKIPNNKNLLRQEEFDEIKRLLYLGESLDDIENETKRSHMTVFRVRRARDLDEYFNLSRYSYAKRVAQERGYPIPAPVAKPEPEPKAVVEQNISVNEFLVMVARMRVLYPEFEITFEMKLKDIEKGTTVL